MSGAAHNLPGGVTDFMIDAEFGDDEHFEACPCHDDPDDGWCECDEIARDLADERRIDEYIESRYY